LLGRIDKDYMSILFTTHFSLQVRSIRKNHSFNEHNLASIYFFFCEVFLFITMELTTPITPPRMIKFIKSIIPLSL